MKILYVSTLCSQKVLDYIFNTAKRKPEQAAQKFHSLIAKGLVFDSNKVALETLSAIPVVPSSHSKKIWKLNKELCDGITYNYIPMFNFKIIKNIGIFVYTFWKVFFWSLFKNKNSKIVICDFLNLTIASASLLACKITSTKIIAIATDIPGLMVTGERNKGILFKVLYTKINNLILYRFSGYVILTKYMNKLVNPNNKPFIIMEGLVDDRMIDSENLLNNKERERVIIYAGGLYEKYGVKKLIEAFLKLEEQDTRLCLYGNGDLVDDIKNHYSQKDKRIVYKGMVHNKIVVKEQLKATLLINPRPTSEEFTLYSFPSKNMEYMVSGTPMITTKLPGMPDEYLDYVKLFEDETIDGIYLALKKTLAISREELHNLGSEAKKFVLENKNNKKQAKRIIEFAKNI